MRKRSKVSIGDSILMTQFLFAAADFEANWLKYVRNKVYSSISIVDLILWIIFDINPTCLRGANLMTRNVCSCVFLSNIFYTIFFLFHTPISFNLNFQRYSTVSGFCIISLLLPLLLNIQQYAPDVFYLVSDFATFRTSITS